LATRTKSRTIPEGEIVGQIPEAGTEVEPDSLVSVTVSLGKAPGSEDVWPERRDRWKWKEVLGAVAVAFAGVAWIVSSVLRITLPTDDYGATIFVIALIGTLVGLVGLHPRQAPSYGWLGLAGFLAAFVGTALALVGGVGGALEDLTFWFGTIKVLFSIGFYGMLVGLALLGVATLRARVLPRWCRVALILTGPVVIFVLSVMPPYGLTGRLYSGGMVLGLIWLALGYVLWSRGGVSAGQSPQRRGVLRRVRRVVVAVIFVALVLLR